MERKRTNMRGRPGHGFQQPRDRDRYQHRTRGSDSPNWREDVSPSPPQPRHAHVTRSQSHLDNANYLQQCWSRYSNTEEKGSLVVSSDHASAAADQGNPTMQAPPIDLEEWIKANNRDPA